MNNDSNQSREKEIRERIIKVIRATEGGANKPLPVEELQKLKSAAGRLDKLLKDAVDAEAQVLKNAAGRLGQLLEDLRTGKDVVSARKRRNH